MPESETSDQRQAQLKCEHLLACRERSSFELRSRLARDGFSEAVIDDLLQRFIACGLVDDERFCQLFIQGKRSLGWGTPRILRELKRFGIETDYRDPDESEYDREVERAISVLQRYHGRCKDLYAGRYRYLASKGFASSVISQALRLAK